MEGLYERKNIQNNVRRRDHEPCDRDRYDRDRDLCRSAFSDQRSKIDKKQDGFDDLMAAVRKGIKISGACLFLIYMVCLVYFLFFAEEYGRRAGVSYDWNIEPFREIRRFWDYREILGFRAVFLNLAGNVIGFMPFGALLPVMARGARRAWKTTILGLEVSVLIEVSQFFFQVGSFDVDDMILNTLGALLGYALFWIVSRCYLKLEAR